MAQCFYGRPFGIIGPLWSESITQVVVLNLDDSHIIIINRLSNKFSKLDTMNQYDAIPEVTLAFFSVLWQIRVSK